ncbi:MAG: phosphate ABC transporter permease PstA [Dermatophilaceae bacterium]
MTAVSQEGAATRLQLSTARLPRWALPALAATTVAAGAVLFALTPLHGSADFVLVVLPVYLVAQTLLVTRVEGARQARNRLATSTLTLAFIVSLIPLVAVLAFTVSRGLRRFDLNFLTHSMRNVAESDPNGGAYHAIIGTLEQVGIASVLAVPIGVLVAIYLVEYGGGRRFARTVSFFVDVMTGLPSIVAGLFIYALWILTLGFRYSGLAGSLALTLLMLPTVVRSTEEMLRLVPHGLRESSLALGVRRWRTIVHIVLPTAMSGIVTGVMLAIARIVGETAPLVLTVFGTNSINNNPFHGAQSALPLFIYSEAGQPNDTAIDRAWAAALTLILIVMLLNLAARLLAWWRAPKSSH